MMDATLQDFARWRAISTLTLLAVLLAWESLLPFFAFFRGKLRERLRHGSINLLLGATNSLMIGFVFAAIWWSAAKWAEAKGVGLLNWVAMPTWARLAVTFLLVDMWLYWWHRVNHRVPFFWRFHRTHHSDPDMDVTTASRFHLGEIAISSLLRVPVIILIGAQLWEVVLYELCMFAVVQLHHANVFLSDRTDRFLRGIIVTPYMHKVHHSRCQPETDSNYSSLFSFWDRLFGSFRLRDDPHTIEFGLDDLSSRDNQTFAAIMATPVKPLQRRQGNIR